MMVSVIRLVPRIAIVISKSSIRLKHYSVTEAGVTIAVTCPLVTSNSITTSAPHSLDFSFSLVPSSPMLIPAASKASAIAPFASVVSVVLVVLILILSHLEVA